MKKAQFRTIGSIIGIIIGIFIGLGILSQTKKSQRGFIGLYAICGGVFVGFIAGFSIGSGLDQEAYVEELLGINKAETEYLKNGRSWIVSTKWTDSNNRHFELLTGKNANKDLVSQLNGEMIFNHNIQSGNKVDVEKYHKIACTHIFNKLKAEIKSS